MGQGGEDKPAQSSSVVAGPVGLTVHFGFDEVGVLHDDGEFGIVEAHL